MNDIQPVGILKSKGSTVQIKIQTKQNKVYDIYSHVLVSVSKTLRIVTCGRKTNGTWKLVGKDTILGTFTILDGG